MKANRYILTDWLQPFTWIQQLVNRISIYKQNVEKWILKFQMVNLQLPGIFIQYVCFYTPFTVYELYHIFLTFMIRIAHVYIYDIYMHKICLSKYARCIICTPFIKELVKKATIVCESCENTAIEIGYIYIIYFEKLDRYQSTNMQFKSQYYESENE